MTNTRLGPHTLAGTPQTQLPPTFLGVWGKDTRWPEPQDSSPPSAHVLPSR